MTWMFCNGTPDLIKNFRNLATKRPMRGPFCTEFEYLHNATINIGAKLFHYAWHLPGKGRNRTPIDQNHCVVAHLEKCWREGVLIKTKSNSKQSKRLTISDFVATAFGRSWGAFRKAMHIKHKRQALIYVTHSLLIGNVQLFARGWVASGVQKKFDVL